ncbi:MAG: hypothetical protein ACRESO_03895 [Gammaproteobacteria bacterium]
MTGFAVTALVVAALLAYPLAVYFAAGHIAPKILMAGVLILLALRMLFIAWRKSRRPRRWLALAGVLLLGAIAVLFTRDFSLGHVRLYPAAIDAVFFLVFFLSLFTRRPLVERFARAIAGDLDPVRIRYTRRVTQVWSGVLLLNTLIALYTAWFASMAVWTLYNGLLSYLLIGAVFVVEYLVRRRVHRAHTQP